MRGPCGGPGGIAPGTGGPTPTDPTIGGIWPTCGFNDGCSATFAGVCFSTNRVKVIIKHERHGIFLTPPVTTIPPLITKRSINPKAHLRLASDSATGVESSDMSLYAGLLTSSARFDCGPPPALSAPINWPLLLVPSLVGPGDFLPFLCLKAGPLPPPLSLPVAELSPPVPLFCESIVASSIASSVVEPTGPNRSTPPAASAGVVAGVADRFRELLLLLESLVSIAVTFGIPFSPSFSSFTTTDAVVVVVATSVVAPRLLLLLLFGELLRLFSCSSPAAVVVVPSCFTSATSICICESSSWPLPPPRLPLNPPPLPPPCAWLWWYLSPFACLYFLLQNCSGHSSSTGEMAHGDVVLTFFGRICTFSPVTGFTTVATVVAPAPAPPLLLLPEPPPPLLAMPSFELDPGSSLDSFRFASSCACLAMFAMLLSTLAEGASVGSPAVALFVPFELALLLLLLLLPVAVVVGVLGVAVAVVLDKRLARPLAPPFRNLLCTCYLVD